MSPITLIVFLLNSPEKIEVNRCPNRRKSSRTTASQFCFPSRFRALKVVFWVQKQQYKGFTKGFQAKNQSRWVLVHRIVWGPESKFFWEFALFYHFKSPSARVDSYLGITSPQNFCKIMRYSAIYLLKDFWPKFALNRW